MFLETSTVDGAADGVVCAVSESQGDSSEVFEASVDSFGGAVVGTRSVEVESRRV